MNRISFLFYFISLLSILLNDTTMASSLPEENKQVTGLVFLDHKEPEDTLSFLRDRNPELVEASKALPRAEGYTDEEIAEDFGAKDDPKGVYLETLTAYLCLSVYDQVTYQGDAVIARRMGDHEADELAIYVRSLGKLSPVETVLCGRQLYPGRTIGEDIIIATQRMRVLLSKCGQAPVLFLGRSPCLVQVAYEELCRLENPDYDRNHILHLSFSGTPDEITSRRGAYFQDKKTAIVRDLVTPDKLAFYERYMTRSGLDKVGDKLYLVDIIGTGTSLNSFLRILRHYYTVTLKRTMPDVHFICLSLTLGTDHGIDCWKFGQNAGKLFCKSDKERGVRPLTIKLTPLQVSHSTIGKILDGDYVQALAVHGIEFPAQKWRDEYLEELEAGGRWHKDFYPVLRDMFSHYQTQYLAKLTEVGNSLIHDVE